MAEVRGGADITKSVFVRLDDAGAPAVTERATARPVHALGARGMNEADALDRAVPTPTARDRHLFGPGRKRILSLDGGGVRGMLTIGILERLEEIIERIEGRPVRLGEWFDLIGGTSTGSIIAALLALGYRAAEIREFFERLTPLIFKRSLRRVVGWNAKFDARNLARELTSVIGARTLESPDLLTGLCIMLKRLDTGSAWQLMNNPRSAFWDDPPDRAHTGNRHFPLANVVRASTAAPGFFDPEPIPIVENQQPGIFIDGALTSHNNPALMLAMAALIPAIGLNWTAGPADLLIVSVGAGSSRPTVTLKEAKKASSLMLALKSLSAIISENQNLVLTIMSYFGQSPLAWPINSEIGDLGPLKPHGGELFRFLRYDVRLEQSWLERELEERLAPQSIAKLRRMDDPSNLASLLRLGRAAAARQVRADHLRGFETNQLC
jgi:predicted acylesterase/phospholipase RssA